MNLKKKTIFLHNFFFAPVEMDQCFSLAHKRCGGVVVYISKFYAHNANISSLAVLRARQIPMGFIAVIERKPEKKGKEETILNFWQTLPRAHTHT